jgi:hypothetical protein
MLPESKRIPCNLRTDSTICSSLSHAPVSARPLTTGLFYGFYRASRLAPRLPVFCLICKPFDFNQLNDLIYQKKKDCHLPGFSLVFTPMALCSAGGGTVFRPIFIAKQTTKTITGGTDEV